MKNITLFLLSSLLIGCSIPNNQDNVLINNQEIQNNKTLKTKSLAKFENPNRYAQFNDLAYQYAWTDIPTGEAYIHYNYARDNEYLSRVRTTTYLTALKCIDEGFDEMSYRSAWADIQTAITNNVIPSAYYHYRDVRSYEPGRITSQVYKDALKTNRVFREEAYMNANPNIHSTIKYALDTNFTTVNHVNGYEHYMLNKSSTSNPSDNSIDPLNNTTYQTALNDHIDGYWEDSYLYAFNDILYAVDNNLYGITRGYVHYSPYGRNENRLSQTAYINALNVGIHPGQSKAIDFEEGVLGSNPSTANQTRVLTFNVLPNRKYRFWLAEMNDGDSYLTIKDSNGNVVPPLNPNHDDVYGLDSYVEFNSPTSGITRYSVEATTSSNGTPSTTPSGKFVLTMFHVIK